MESTIFYADNIPYRFQTTQISDSAMADIRKRLDSTCCQNSLSSVNSGTICSFQNQIQYLQIENATVNQRSQLLSQLNSCQNTVRPGYCFNSKKEEKTTSEGNSGGADEKKDEGKIDLPIWSTVVLSVFFTAIVLLIFPHNVVYGIARAIAVLMLVKEMYK